MHRASLLALAVLAVSLAGCAQQPEPAGPQGPSEGGGTSGTNVTAGANVTAGNTTAGGNVTGNATEPNMTRGNETGSNMTGNATGNLTAKELLNHTYDYDVLPPADATFQVDAAGYARLKAFADSDGTVVGLKVTLKDPGGNSTVLIESGTTKGDADLPHPAQGTWTLHFEGNGVGSVHVTVRVE
jgi:hypothetical protein